MKRRASLFLVVLFFKLPYSIRPLVSAPAITTLTLRKKQFCVSYRSFHTQPLPPPPPLSLPQCIVAERKKSLRRPGATASTEMDLYPLRALRAPPTRFFSSEREMCSAMTRLRLIGPDEWTPGLEPFLSSSHVGQGDVKTLAWKTSLGGRKLVRLR